MIYDNKYIPIAIRPNAKLGKLTVSLTGKYYAYDAGLDGFNLVEVKPQQLTVTERDFLCGNLLKETIVADETVTKFVTPLTNTFPNLRFVVITYVGGVAEGLDTSFAGLSVTFVVPNSLLSGYQSAYPSLTFTSWNFQQEFEIPYIGNSELTIEYVSLVCSGASGDIQTVDKVIIPPEFTSFETGVFDYIFLKFENAEEIGYGDVRLPPEYREVEYIDSTGTQYIDTGVYLTNIRVLAKFEFLETTVWKGAFGYHVTNSQSFRIDSNNWIIRNGYVNMGTEATFMGGVFEVDMKMSSGDSYLIANGQTYGTSSTTYTTGSLDSYKLQIFSNGTNDSKSKLRLYEMTLYQDGAKVRDFIPCYRKSDNVIGLYDLVNNVFYTNSGTGTFAKGRDNAFVVTRPALSTATIIYDENTSHTLTPEIVQATLAEVPEFASCEKVIVPEWFTNFPDFTNDIDFYSMFPNLEEVWYGNGLLPPLNIYRVAGYVVSPGGSLLPVNRSFDGPIDISFYSIGAGIGVWGEDFHFGYKNQADRWEEFANCIFAVGMMNSMLYSNFCGITSVFRDTLGQYYGAFPRFFSANVKSGDSKVSVQEIKENGKTASATSTTSFSYPETTPSLRLSRGSNVIGYSDIKIDGGMTNYWRPVVRRTDGIAGFYDMVTQTFVGGANYSEYATE